VEAARGEQLGGRGQDLLSAAGRGAGGHGVQVSGR
jgi:hypothetical protein